GLFRRTPDRSPKKEPAMAYEFETRQLTTTPVLYQARRVATDDMATVLAECLPAVFGYVVEQGLAMAGPPYVRYVDTSPAFVSIEGGIPLVETPAPPPSELEIVAGELPAGPALVTVHRGPYDTLGDAHIALDRHMAEHGLTPASPPWEVYLTDPGEVPDPADWLTEVLWPLR
ncbi:MAG: GyrI-like domain-containing protein, partial [Actinomycetota bacterium]